MKFHVLVFAAVAFGFVSHVHSQVVGTSADRDALVPPEIAVLLSATALAKAGDLPAAWETLATVDTARGKEFSAPPAQLGWRVAGVAGGLRNSGDYRAADAFARYALGQAWFENSRALGREERGDVAYWCAWLATEILDDRVSALAWIEQAAGDRPDSERISKLRERLEAAEREFPSR
jgi:hypothetical protein